MTTVLILFFNPKPYKILILNPKPYTLNRILTSLILNRKPYTLNRFLCQYHHQVIKTTPWHNTEDFSQPLCKESVDQGRLWINNQASLSVSPKNGD